MQKVQGKQEMRVSVRALVETVLMGGDIAPGNLGAMVEGMRGHKRLQGSYGEEADSEVSLRQEARSERFLLTVHGRADVVWMRDGLPVAVEEIKVTRRDPGTIGAEDYPLHWAQAECYAHMLCERHDLPGIAVRLTYAAAGGGGEARLTRQATRQALAEQFDALTKIYLMMAEANAIWREGRDRSIRALGFPYDGYRAGQREMAGKAYIALRDGARLFCEAPTGIGKTAAMLFSSLKAMGEGHVGKIFYLTARGTQGVAAQEGMERLRARGLRARSIALTAKEKICPLPGTACTPEDCPRAKGHYDRLRGVMEEALEQREDFDAAALLAIADRHHLCPFELGLDLSMQCDVVIGDYNYAFDPTARLKRYFQEKSDACLLIDEAHNLPDRARAMFSAEIGRQPLQELRREIGAGSRQDPLYKALGGILRAMKSLREDVEGITVVDYPSQLHEAVEIFIEIARERLNEPALFQDKLLDRFFEAMAFDAAAQEMRDYPQCYAGLNQPTGVALYCVDPAPQLHEVLAKVKGAVFFSATLSPLSYYARLSGSGDAAEMCRLPSPFAPENLRVLLAPIATSYRRREETATEVARAIAAMAAAKERGSYFAFFPSYAYMQQILPLVRMELPAARVIVQRAGMRERERAQFLEEFPPEPRGILIAGAVMGGLFGEGIDLPGNRLSGCAVVGVGLPQISAEREVLRERFEEDGFAFAYAYPGMTRVVQAAGRVIRTEADRGVVLLIDERFAMEMYEELLPPHWQVDRVKGPKMLARLAREFWAGGS